MQNFEQNPKQDNENEHAEMHAQDLERAGDVATGRRTRKLLYRPSYLLIVEISALIIALVAAVLIPQMWRTSPPETESLVEPLKAGNIVPGSVARVIYTSNEQGHVSALNAQDGKLLWKVTIKDDHYLSYDVPLSSNDKVFVRGFNQDSVAVFYALNASDGKLLWSYRDANIVTVSNGIVFALSSNGILALREGDGSVLWTYAVKEPLAFYRLNAVSNGVVYGTVNRERRTSTVEPAAFALRASDGQVLWRYTTSTWVFVRGEHNGTVYIDIDSEIFGAIRDGRLLWKYAMPGKATPEEVQIENGIVYLSATAENRGVTGYPPPPGPSWHISVVYPLMVGQTTQKPFALQLRPAMPDKVGKVAIHAFREADGTPLWSQDLTPGTFGMDLGFSVKNGVVYTTIGLSDQQRIRPQKNIITALDSKDGKALWRIETTQPFSELYVGDKSLFLSSYHGEQTAFSLLDGSVQWQSKVAATLDYTPALLENTLYTGVVGRVYALDIMTGAVSWQYTG